MNGKAQSLANIRLFSGLDVKDLADIEKRCNWRGFAPQEQIIDRQDDTRDVFLITKGAVRVVNYSYSGREIAFDDIREGNIFGELAALDGEPRSANVVALEPTEAAILSPQVFLEVLEEYPLVAHRLMQRLAQVIRISTDRIMDLSTLGANNRVYAELLRLAKATADEETNTAYISPIPIHGDIASRVSTTRETVARVLSDLTKKKLVMRDGNRLVIHDLEHLQDMVEEFRGE